MGLAPPSEHKVFDYENQLGVAAGLIGGFKKTVYNSSDSIKDVAKFIAAFFGSIAPRGALQTV